MNFWLQVEVSNEIVNKVNHLWFRETQNQELCKNSVLKLQFKTRSDQVRIKTRIGIQQKLLLLLIQVRQERKTAANLGLKGIRAVTSLSRDHNHHQLHKIFNESRLLNLLTLHENQEIQKIPQWLNPKNQRTYQFRCENHSESLEHHTTLKL